MKRTGPASWLFAHLCRAARMLWPDPKPPPLPQRQRKTPPEWRKALSIHHPDYWCSLSTVQQQEWADIERRLWGSLSAQQQEEWADVGKQLGNLPAVPQPRREQP